MFMKCNNICLLYVINKEMFSKMSTLHLNVLFASHSSEVQATDLGSTQLNTKWLTGFKGVIVESSLDPNTRIGLD